MLGSILAGLKAIVNVIGMTKMTPPIKDLLPRLTPILKNRFVNYYNNTCVLVWLVGALNGLLLYLEVVFVVVYFMSPWQHFVMALGLAALSCCSSFTIHWSGHAHMTLY